MLTVFILGFLVAAYWLVSLIFNIQTALELRRDSDHIYEDENGIWYDDEFLDELYGVDENEQQ